MDIKEKMKNILLANVNVSGVALGVLDDIIEEALQRVVDNTSNPYDNMIKDMLWPLVRAEIARLLDEKFSQG
jgi:hypothetical protein